MSPADVIPLASRLRATSKLSTTVERASRSALAMRVTDAISRAREHLRPLGLEPAIDEVCRAAEHIDGGSSIGDLRGALEAALVEANRAKFMAIGAKRALVAMNRREARSATWGADALEQLVEVLEEAALAARRVRR